MAKESSRRYLQRERYRWMLIVSCWRAGVLVETAFRLHSTHTNLELASCCQVKPHIDQRVSLGLWFFLYLACRFFRFAWNFYWILDWEAGWMRTFRMIRVLK